MKSIEISDGKESWNAKVRSPENLGKCQEIRIESRSGITLIIGKYSSGWFACMPDFKVGVGLLEFLQDVKYNTYVLERQIGNPVDAATVAQVLKVLDKEGVLSK